MEETGLRGEGEGVRPRVTVSERDEDEELLIYLRLVKGGWASGFDEAKRLNVREVLQALHYDTFLVDYEKAYIDLNRPS